MKFLLYVFLLSIALLSCRGGNNPSNFQGGYSETAVADAPDLRVAKDEATPQEPNPVTIERKIIKTGNIRFESPGLGDTRNNILESLKKHKGYVSREEENNYGDRVEQTIEVRIPSEEFDVFLAEITAGVKRFDFKNINTNDVTEEFIDVESRLNTKKELEKRYMEILSKARTVTEMLEIERELNNVRSDIESMTGRLKFLQSQVSFSTLNIAYYEVNVQPLGFGNKIIQGVSNGWQYLLKFLILIVNLWPFIILAGGTIWFVKWYSGRARNKAEKGGS